MAKENRNIILLKAAETTSPRKLDRKKHVFISKDLYTEVDRGEESNEEDLGKYGHATIMRVTERRARCVRKIIS